MINRIFDYLVNKTLLDLLNTIQLFVITMVSCDQIDTVKQT